MAARGDAGEDPFDGLAQHGGVLQEQPFQVPRHGAQAALEVRLHRRLARVGPEALLAAVGEQPGQGDQAEVGEQLLLDRALGLAVELLHRQQLLGNLVQLLDAPAAVVQVGEVPHAVALPVQQGGGEGVGGRAGGVLDEAHPAGLEGGLRVLAQRVGAGRDGDRVIGAVAEDEVAEQGGGVPLEAEDGLQAAFGVGVQQLEGVVTAVVDDDIAGGERPEVGQGRQALVAMGEQVEVDRDAGAQLVEAAEQALRVVGVR